MTEVGTPIWLTPTNAAPATIQLAHGNHQRLIQRGSWACWCDQALRIANNIPKEKRSSSAGSQTVMYW